MALFGTERRSTRASGWEDMDIEAWTPPNEKK
jgi:hypothetical protein